MDIHRPVDFRNVYLGAQLLSAGSNPYDDSLLKAQWQHIADQEGFTPKDQPGFPNNPLLYPPWALTLFTPLAALPFRTAYALWYLFIPCCLALSVFFVYRTYFKQSALALLDLFLLVLAFKGTSLVFLVGQPSFLSFAALFGAWYFYTKDQALPTGILLGIGACKITLALPLVVFFLLRRAWKPVGIGAAVGAVLWLIAVLMADAPVEMHQLLWANMQTFRDLLYAVQPVGEPIFFLQTQLTELGVLVHFFSPGSVSGLGIFYLFGILIAGTWVGRLIWTKKVDDLTALLLLYLAFFLFNYFQFYDLVLLLWLYPLVRPWSRRWQVAVILLCIPLFIPFNGLLQRLDLPQGLHFLYLHTPIVLIGLWIVLGLRVYFRAKVVPS